MKTRRILNPMAIAAEGAALLPVEQRERIQQTNAAALDALRKGIAEPAHISRLSFALLLADTLARIAPLAKANRHQEIAAGIDALAAVTQREAQRGHAIATGLELQAIRDALAVHHIQINHAALSEVEAAQAKIDAMRKTQNRRAA
jgi:hypothetical protein